MENAKLDRVQFFILLMLFEMGTSLVIALGINAGRDAWIAIFFGALCGCFLFLIYFQLYKYYPADILTTYINKIVGKWLGIPLSFLYIIYFLYLCSRVLRDFGELLLTFAYPETPLFIINALMILVVIYGVTKGIEAIARTAQLNFTLLYILAFIGIVLVWMSEAVIIDRIRPVLENGIMPVVKTVATQTLYVPFGEVIIFTFIFPYLNNNKKARTIGIVAVLLSGINLSITMAINIISLGIPVVEDSPFPLLATIQEISVAEFLERLDVFFLVALFIGAFFKIAIFFYGATVALADVFKLSSHRQVVFPLGIIVLFLSMTIASNFAEHMKEGLEIVPVFFHLPMQVIIPVALLIIAFFKNRKKKQKANEGTTKEKNNDKEEQSMQADENNNAGQTNHRSHEDYKDLGVDV